MTHAYGSAKDVPAWLRKLSSDNEQMRSSALMDLYGSICHQNWNCPATAYAVPYVIELLQQPSVEQRTDLLEMLADIATCEPLDEATWRENTRVPSLNVPKYISLKDAHAAVAAGIPTYIALLGDPNQAVRVQAAHVLTSFPEYCDDIAPALESALGREVSESGRADLTFALGLLFSSSPERWRRFEPTFEQPESDLLRFVAALIIVRLAKENTPEPVIQYLGAIAQQRETPPSLSAFADLAIIGYEPRAAALDQLLRVGGARLAFLCRPLMERAAGLRAQLGDDQKPFSDGFAFNKLMEWLIITLFDQSLQTAGAEPPPVADLTAEQRDFLLFALDKGYWNYFDFTHWLADHRLPSKRTTLAEYLGVPAPKTHPKRWRC